jgi:hypothetical protein
MINVSFFISIPYSQEYNPKDDLLRKSYYIILARQLLDHGIKKRPDSFGIVSFKNKKGGKTGFFKFFGS